MIGIEPPLRPRHLDVVRVLERLDFAEALAGFRMGGGTLVALLSGEYRVSNDIDLLCDNPETFNRFVERQSLFPENPVFWHGNFFPRVLSCRRDRDAVRFEVENPGGPAVKIEVLILAPFRFGTGETLAIGETHVPCLCLEDLAASKLKAIMERGLSRATRFRDTLDLLALLDTHPLCLPAIVSKTEEFMGKGVLPDLSDTVRQLLRDPAFLGSCFSDLGVEGAWQERLRSRLQGLPAILADCLQPALVVYLAEMAGKRTCEHPSALDKLAWLAISGNARNVSGKLDGKAEEIWSQALRYARDCLVEEEGPDDARTGRGDR